MMKDIINVFSSTYDDIALIAGKVSKTGAPLNPKVKISHITPYNKKSPIRRLLSWINATIETLFLVIIKYRNYHLFISSNPPTLAFLPIFCRNNYSVIIYDVYPDGLVAGKFISEKSIYNRIWVRWNRRYLKRARNIFTLTDSMADTISKYISRERIKVVPPWSVFSEKEKVKKEDNLFIKEHNLNNFFIVMYSGNIGLGHNLESIIEVAKLLRKIDDIRFIIIGEGWNKSLIEKRIADYGLTNCILLPFQTSEMFRHSLSAADLGVVSVSSEGSKICTPSKTYNLISLLIPLLCITESETELAFLIKKCHIGFACGHDQIKEMADYILLLRNDQTFRTGIINNLKLCASNFTNKNAYNYINYFNNN